MKELEPNSVCELLYKLRDAVSCDNIIYAIFLSREVHEKLLMIHSHNKNKCCDLNCDTKEDK